MPQYDSNSNSRESVVVTHETMTKLKTQAKIEKNYTTSAPKLLQSFVLYMTSLFHPTYTRCCSKKDDHWSADASYWRWWY